MSLVVLKNFFMYRTIVPKSPKQNREQVVPNFDFTAATQPLLPANANANINPHSETIDRNHDDDESTLDLESQDSRSEKSSQEKEWINPRTVGDATIGLSDGLTVPFALTAGLSAFGDSRLVLVGGMAELIAGAISMGLGGYLAAKGERASYDAQRQATIERIDTDLQGAICNVMKIYEPYNFSKQTIENYTTDLANFHPDDLVNFIMRFQHCLEEPDEQRSLKSAVTIAGGYFFGGLFPLIPYWFAKTVYDGLMASIVVMVIILFAFGYVKTGINNKSFCGGESVRKCLKGAVEMVLIGSIAAAAAMVMVWVVQKRDPGMGF